MQTWTLSDVGAVSRQAHAVLGVMTEALGVHRFVAVGICLPEPAGAELRLGSGLSRRRVPRRAPLDDGGLARVSRSVGERTVFSYVRSHAALRRLADPGAAPLRPRKPAAGVVGAFDLLDRAAITFLYGEVPQEDHYSRRSREVLDGLRAASARTA